jgi:uncharacterized protein (DUF488 family)
MTTGECPMPSSQAFDLFTIGHSNQPIERFLALLRDAGVTALADVRSTPFSRRFPWFSAKPLRARLEAEGVAYLAMGDALGGRPRDPALFRDGVADYQAMAAMPEFHAGIERVIATTRHHRVCLMCAERDPLDCHRCLLVAPALAARGLDVGHVLSDGSILAHAAIEERLLADEEGDDLFATDRTDRLARAYRRRASTVAFRLPR